MQIDFSIIPDTALPEAPFVIYGAGNIGRTIINVLSAKSIPVAAWLDRRAGLPEYCGITPIIPEDANDNTKHLPVIVAVFSPPAECGFSVIEKYLCGLGFAQIYSFEYVFQAGLLGFDSTFMWMAAPAFFRQHKNEIISAEQLFRDEKSRDLFSRLINLRLGADLSILPEPDPLEQQYFDSGIHNLPLQDGFIFADIGAYNGDTIASIIAHKLTPGTIIALEPDQKNFAALQEFVKSSILNNVCHLHMAGAGKSNGVAGFACGCNDASHIEADAQDIIRIIAFDELFSDIPFDFIKMDIEGGEQDALFGMKKIIAARKPALAISLYHRPEDIFSIPLFLNQLNPDYSFYLRNYGEHAMETVLYAINQ